MKKVHRAVKFNQNTWLKPYIDINTDLRKKAKIDFQKKDFFFSWWIIQFLEKLWKMLEDIEILNLLQQEEEEII